MISKIIWELREDRSIRKVTKLTNRLYANSKASAEYNLISDAILPTDTVKMILTVGEKEYHKLLAYGNVLLETGETVKGWFIVSNGEELAVEIEDNGYETMIVAFEIKRFSSLDSQTLLTSFTSPQDTVLIYASSSYTPMVEPTDAELLENEISKINVKLDDKVDKTAEHPGGGVIAATKSEILNNGGIALSSSTTNLEENISKTLAITPYGVSIITNNTDSDAVATKSQLDKKVDKKIVTDKAISTIVNIDETSDILSIVVDGKTEGSVDYNSIQISPTQNKLEAYNSHKEQIGSLPPMYITERSYLKVTPSKVIVNHNGAEGVIARIDDVDNKSTADRLYVDTKINAIKKSVGYVFDTYNNFFNWIDGTYVREDGLTTSDLNIGDDIFIVEEGVPDYWVKSKSYPMTITDFAPYESGDYKPTITWLED